MSLSVSRPNHVRDVLDSSLDDVIHISPRTLEESQAILQHRVPGLSVPFIALAHCLSGGITRDLIRYTRRIVMVPGVTGWRLRELARELLLQELQETLSGFRVRLSETRTDHRLEELRSAVSQLRERREGGQTPLLYETVQHLLDITTMPPGTPRSTCGKHPADVERAGRLHRLRPDSPCVLR